MAAPASRSFGSGPAPDPLRPRTVFRQCPGPQAVPRPADNPEISQWISRKPCGPLGACLALSVCLPTGTGVADLSETGPSFAGRPLEPAPRSVGPDRRMRADNAPGPSAAVP